MFFHCNQFRLPNKPRVVCNNTLIAYLPEVRFLSIYITGNLKWNVHVNKNPTRCNSMQIFIYCKVSLHVSGVTAPIIRSTKNCNCSLGTGRNTGTATSFQRGLIGPWKEVAVPVLRPVLEAAVTVFSTPDDGCCDTQNM